MCAGQGGHFVSFPKCWEATSLLPAGGHVLAPSKQTSAGASEETRVDFGLAGRGALGGGGVWGGEQLYYSWSLQILFCNPALEIMRPLSAKRLQTAGRQAGHCGGVPGRLLRDSCGTEAPPCRWTSPSVIVIAHGRGCPRAVGWREGNLTLRGVGTGGGTAS